MLSNQVIFIAFLTILILKPNAFTDASPEQDALIVYLLKTYKTTTTPVSFEGSLPLQVKVAMDLLQIIKVDEKHKILVTQIWLASSWFDVSLKWEPKLFHNITLLRVPAERIWKPDMIPYNAADQDVYQSINDQASGNAFIHHNGKVLYPHPNLQY